MVTGKLIIRSSILDKFRSWLMDCNIVDIKVTNMIKPASNYSALYLETVVVEFLADEAKVGKIVKRMIDSAKRGEFGNHKIILAPFRRL